MGRKRTPGLFLRGEIWHIDKRTKYAPGGRLRESTGETEIEEAETYLARRLTELKNAVIHGTGISHTFEEAAVRFIMEYSHQASIVDRAKHLEQAMPFVGSLSVDQVNDEALQQYFRDHRAEFVAREERAMRHILVTVAPGAGEDDVAKAQGKANDLLAQLRGGADFASLAQANSDDPGSAKSGGDLGWVERGLMVPAFEDAAFALAKEEFSDPVRTEFGFHIIQVTDVRGGSDATFADMRDKVEAAYRKFEAENLYFDYAERLAQSAYENSASLTPAAEALGLTVRTTDWVTRSGQLPAPLDAPKVMNAVFSDDVLAEGHNSELIEVGPQRAVVLRVAEHEAAGVLGFDQNRQTIESDFRKANASEMAAQTGVKFLGELESGNGNLTALATEQSWPVEAPGRIGRNDHAVPAEVLAKVFALAPPQSSKPQYAGVVSAEGDYFLIEVDSVQGGELASMPQAERAKVMEQAVAQAANAQLNYFTSSLREQADIKLVPIKE